jgi:hypothetical protein
MSPIFSTSAFSLLLLCSRLVAPQELKLRRAWVTGTYYLLPDIIICRYLYGGDTFMEIIRGFSCPIIGFCSSLVCLDNGKCILQEKSYFLFLPEPLGMK